ncbi:hypothetical protein Hanom_Chr16g01507991 [Helianthus anomalus]
MYVMLALYFFSCVRDVILIEYFARICVGYRCFLVFFVITVYMWC